MMTQQEKDNFEVIKKRLSDNIRVSVGWDGYTPDDLQAQYNADIECDTFFSANDLLESVQNSIGIYEDGDQVFSDLQKECKVLDKKISEWAKGIHERGRNFVDPKTLTDRYFEISARKFEDANKDNCIVTAPPHWLPC